MRIKLLIDKKMVLFFRWVIRLSNYLNKIVVRFISVKKQNCVVDYLISGVEHPLSLVRNDMDSNDIIWTCWFQGFENAPEIVRRCISSFENIKGKKVIVIDETNFQNYISLPASILQKFFSGVINYTAFSEIIRLELLASYGGMWLDATMFIPKELKIDCNKYDFFSPVEKERVESHELFGLFPMFFIYCKSEYAPIIKIRNYILNYWLNNDSQIDYFMVDHFFKYEYINNPEFRNDVDSVPVLGKSLHSLELYYLDERYSDKIRIFMKNDPLGIFKLNHKNKHSVSSGNLYGLIVTGSLII